MMQKTENRSQKVVSQFIIYYRLQQLNMTTMSTTSTTDVVIIKMSLRVSLLLLLFLCQSEAISYENELIFDANYKKDLNHPSNLR